MKIKHWIMIGLVGVLTMGAALGCRHHASPEKKLEGIIHHLTDDLNLTQEQQGVLEKFKSELLASVKKVQAARDKARQEIMVQIKGETLDQPQVLAAIDGVKAEVDDIITLAVAHMAEFHRTLSPEQKSLLVKKLEDLHKLHGCGN